MSTTIDELMVSLGIEMDTQSVRNAQSSFAQLESSALRLGRSLGGPAVAGAIMGVGASTAKTTAELGRFAKEAGVSAQYVSGLEYAFRQSGGSAEDARASIGGMLDLWRDFQVGNTSKADQAAMFGFDTADVLRAQDMQSAIEAIASQTSQMGPAQRRNVLNALGIGGQGAQTLFGEGTGQLQEYLKTAKELAPVTDDMVAASIDATQALGELSLAFKGFRDEMAMGVMPGLTEAMREVTAILGMVRNAGDEEGSAGWWAKELWNSPNNAVEWLGEPEQQEIINRTWGEWWDKLSAEGDARRADDFGKGVYIRPSASLDPSDPIDDNVLRALALQESGGKHRGEDGRLTRSHAGALGAYQIKPTTGERPGYGITPLKSNSEADQKEFADEYLTVALKRYGSLDKAYASYNAGIGATDKAIRTHGADWLSALPPETRAYVPSVKGKLAQMEGGRPQASMNGPITFNIHGATDVDAVGREVERRIGIMARQAGDDMASGVV